MKQLEKNIKEWEKKQERARKRGEPVEESMPIKPLEVKVNAPSNMAPDQNPLITFDTPLEVLDTAKIHLYSQQDTLWFRSPMLIRPHAVLPRTYEVVGEWRPEGKYSLEADSAAFVNIYGTAANATKAGFQVASNDQFATILFTVSGLQCDHLVAELLSSSDAPVKTAKAERGTVEFFYVTPGTYYLRLYEDLNDNGRWDTGNYDLDLQAEPMYYYPEKIECKANWDLTLPTWQPAMLNAARQKPEAITKQKGERGKTIKRRNYERARQLGIEYVKENIPY